MLNRADELAAHDNYHGQATWRPIIEPSASWSTSHCPVHCIDGRKFRSANPIPGPSAGFILDNRFFENRAARQEPRSHASFMRGPEPSLRMYYKGLVSGMRTCS